jgi:hypothetical protein
MVTRRSFFASVYFLNATHKSLIASYPAQSNVSVFLDVQANWTTLVVNAVYENNSYSNSSEALAKAYTNVTFLSQGHVSWRLFHNLTIAFPVEGGVAYLTVEPNGSFLRSPSGEYIHKGEFVTFLNQTPYGTLVVATPTPEYVNPFSPLHGEVSISQNFTVYLLGNWNETFMGLPYGDYLVNGLFAFSNPSVSNTALVSGETFFLDLEDGKKVMTLPRSCLQERLTAPLT